MTDRGRMGRLGMSRVVAVAAGTVAAAVALLGFPSSSGAEVTGVTGSAFGYSASVSLFGGPAQTAGPTPEVTLPAAGSAAPITASEPTGVVQFGPASMFSSGPITVSTAGTLGDAGSVTSQTTIETINTSGDEVFTAASASSTCTADESGVTAATTIVDGTLDLGGGETVAVPANPAPNTTFTGTVDNVNDDFEYVFNEQIVNADGSITVYAGHLRLLGPTAVGDLYWGKSECGVTATTTTTTMDPTTTTTGDPTTTTTGDPTTTTTGDPTTTTTMDPTTTTTGDPTTTTTGATTTTTTGATTTTTGATTTTTGPTTTTTPMAACDPATATIVGTPGDDTITGTAGADVIVALGGNDKVHGMGGDDIICGGAGDDSLHGGQGDDQLVGGEGDDHLVGAQGADQYDGGAGDDVCAGGSSDAFSDCEGGRGAKMVPASAGTPAAGGVTVLVGLGLLMLIAVADWPGLLRRARRR